MNAKGPVWQWVRSSQGTSHNFLHFHSFLLAQRHQFVYLLRNRANHSVSQRVVHGCREPQLHQNMSAHLKFELKNKLFVRFFSYQFNFAANNEFTTSLNERTSHLQQQKFSEHKIDGKIVVILLWDCCDNVIKWTSAHRSSQLVFPIPFYAIFVQFCAVETWNACALNRARLGKGIPSSSFWYLCGNYNFVVSTKV